MAGEGGVALPEFFFTLDFHDDTECDKQKSTRSTIDAFIFFFKQPMIPPKCFDNSPPRLGDAQKV